MTDGRVVRIAAEVVDVAFAGRVPDLYGGVLLLSEDGGSVPVEVVAHLGGGRVRAVALARTDRIGLGAAAVPTGGPVDVPVGAGLLGRVVGALGDPLDGRGPVDATARRPLRAPPPSFLELGVEPRVFETGVKWIDLLAPWPKGGRIGLVTDGAPVSPLLASIVRGFARRSGVSVLVGIGEGAPGAHQLWEEVSDPRPVLLVAQAHEPPGARWAVAQAGAAVAEGFRDEGRDVLLVLVDRPRLEQAASALASALEHSLHGPTVGLSAFEERFAATRRGSITAVEVVGPVDAAELVDARVAVAASLWEWGFRPPVDPRGCSSRLLDPQVVGPAHAAVAREVRAVLAAYEGLGDAIARDGMDELAAKDRYTVALARKLRWFGTQPPDVYVALADTVRGFRDLLDGRGDDLAEDAFIGVGTFDDAVARHRERYG